MKRSKARVKKTSRYYKRGLYMYCNWMFTASAFMYIHTAIFNRNKFLIWRFVTTSRSLRAWSCKVLRRRSELLKYLLHVKYTDYVINFVRFIHLLRFKPAHFSASGTTVGFNVSCNTKLVWTLWLRRAKMGDQAPYIPFSSGTKSLKRELLWMAVCLDQ